MPLQLFEGGLERSRATAANGVFEAEEEFILLLGSQHKRSGQRDV